MDVDAIPHPPAWVTTGSSILLPSSDRLPDDCVPARIPTVPRGTSGNTARMTPIGRHHHPWHPHGQTESGAHTALCRLPGRHSSARGYIHSSAHRRATGRSPTRPGVLRHRVQLPHHCSSVAVNCRPADDFGEDVPVNLQDRAHVRVQYPCPCRSCVHAGPVSVALMPSRHRNCPVNALGTSIRAVERKEVAREQGARLRWPIASCDTLNAVDDTA